MSRTVCKSTVRVAPAPQEVLMEIVGFIVVTVLSGIGIVVIAHALIRTYMDD